MPAVSAVRVLPGNAVAGLWKYPLFHKLSRPAENGTIAFGEFGPRSGRSARPS